MKSTASSMDDVECRQHHLDQLLRNDHNLCNSVRHVVPLVDRKNARKDSSELDDRFLVEYNHLLAPLFDASVLVGKDRLALQVDKIALVEEVKWRKVMRKDLHLDKDSTNGDGVQSEEQLKL